MTGFCQLNHGAIGALLFRFDALHQPLALQSLEGAQQAIAGAVLVDFTHALDLAVADGQCKCGTGDVIAEIAHRVIPIKKPLAGRLFVVAWLIPAVALVSALTGAAAGSAGES